MRPAVEADAALGREVGALPILLVGEGERVPAAPDAVAFLVLDGLLAGDAGTMAGPGDVIVAPSGCSACTHVRLAVIGSASPAATPKLLAHARERPIEPAPGGALDERVLGLLWRLASRWGQPDGRGMMLALPHEPSGLARLLSAREPDVAAALAELADRDLVHPHEDGGWRLRAPAHGRRDELRARAAQQIARARQAVADCAALVERADSEISRSRRRRS